MHDSLAPVPKLLEESTKTNEKRLFVGRTYAATPSIGVMVRYATLTHPTGATQLK